MKRLLILAVLAASPVRAEMAFKADDLLAARETAMVGALIACATGVTDPEAADRAFTKAGWTRTEDEGSWNYTSENLSAMVWTVPGFCMVEDTEIGTAGMATDFLGLSSSPPDEGKDEQGCRTFDMGNDVTATLTGPGQDPTCDSAQGAAMRFALPED